MELPSPIRRVSQQRPVGATVPIDCDWRVTLTAGALRTNDRQETMRNEFRFPAQPASLPAGRPGSWAAGRSALDVIYILF